MRWLKKEYRGVVVSVTYVRTRHGIKEFEVEFADGTTTDVPEHELDQYFEEDR